MKPLAHVLSSAMVGLSSGMLLHSPEAGLAGFTAGVLIDLDHCLDYVRRRDIMSLSLKGFFQPEDWGPRGPLVLLFHAWEYLPILFLLSLLFPYRGILIAVFWGVLVHLTLDHLSNHGHPLTYFISFRALRKFDYHHFFPQSPHLHAVDSGHSYHFEARYHRGEELVGADRVANRPSAMAFAPEAESKADSKVA